MSLTFQRERVHGLWEEAARILDEGFREFEPLQELGPLKVDRRLYEMLEDAGNLRVYTARLDWWLVGYACFMVNKSVRRDFIQAEQDVLHVLKEHRVRVTAALVKYADKELAAEGVKLVYHSTPINGSRFGRLLELLGYRAVAQVYARVL